MLGGDQRTDEMKRGLGQCLESFRTVVAFVEDQRDVLTRLSQIAVMGGQVAGDRTELDTIVDIAGVDSVKQWNVKISAHQQSQIDLPQVDSLLFVMAPLRQFRRGARIQVSEEVGAIVDQSPEVELESLDQTLRHLALELEDLVAGNEIHVVPKVLRGEQSGI